MTDSVAAASEGGAEASEERSAEVRLRLRGDGRGARDAGEDEGGSAAGEGVATVGKGGVVATSGERRGWGWGGGGTGRRLGGRERSGQYFHV